MAQLKDGATDVGIDVEVGMRAHHNVNSPGWVYIEGRMSAKLRELLGRCNWTRKKNTGRKMTVRTSEGGEARVAELEAQVQEVPAEDWRDIISVGSQYKAGQWVRVLQGPYKRDIAIVEHVGKTNIYLLVVPRIPADGSGNKRKAGTKSVPARLFNPTRKYGGVKLVEDRRGNVESGCYKVNGHEFVLGGLLRIRCARGGVCSRDLYMIGDVATQFQLSELPRSWKQRMPLPIEWRFELKDRVRVKDCEQKGSIVELFQFEDQQGACIQSELEEGIVPIRCQRLQKLFCIGEYVECRGGGAAGRQGWIEHIDEDKGRVYIIEKTTSMRHKGRGEQVAVS